MQINIEQFSIENLASYPIYIPVILVIIALAFLLKPTKSIPYLILFILLSILFFFYYKTYLSFLEVAIIPAIHMILNGKMPTNLVGVSSILIFIGICIIMVAVIYNIIDGYVNDDIGIWR